MPLRIKKYSKQINTKLDREHKQMLTDLCNYLGLDQSKTVRQALKEMHKRIFGEDRDKNQRLLNGA